MSLELVGLGTAVPDHAITQQEAATRSVLSDHGNMSSSTILFILERLRPAAAPGPCPAIAFGPGLPVDLAVLGR